MSAEDTQMLMAITGIDNVQIAKHLLEACNGDLNAAAEAFLTGGQEEAASIPPELPQPFATAEGGTGDEAMAIAASVDHSIHSNEADFEKALADSMVERRLTQVHDDEGSEDGDDDEMVLLGDEDEEMGMGASGPVERREGVAELALQLMALTGMEDLGAAKNYLEAFNCDINAAAAGFLDGNGPQAIDPSSGSAMDIEKGPLGAEFASLFEKKFGLLHPVFFMEDYVSALRVAKMQGRLLLVYVYSDYEPESSDHFCRTVLCMGAIADVSDANFVFYGCRQQASHAVMSKITNAYAETPQHPFMAIVMPAIHSSSGGEFTEPKVLHRLNGVLTADELKFPLEATWRKYAAEMEGLRAVNVQIEADRQLKLEQDLELKEAMLMDKFKADEADRQKEEEQLKGILEASKKQAEVDAHTAAIQNRRNKVEALPAEPPMGEKPSANVQVSLPDGTKLKRRFRGDVPVQVLYDWVSGHSSLIDRPATSQFQLAMNYPRKVLDSMEQTMHEEGLCPQAMLLVNMIEQENDSPVASPHR